VYIILNMLTLFLNCIPEIIRSIIFYVSWHSPHFHRIYNVKESSMKAFQSAIRECLSMPQEYIIEGTDVISGKTSRHLLLTLDCSFVYLNHCLLKFLLFCSLDYLVVQGWRLLLILQLSFGLRGRFH
jgi:hypothetical protein